MEPLLTYHFRMFRRRQQKTIRLCDATVKKVMGYSPEAVLCQGEFTLAFQIINTLLEQDVTVVAACSERVVKENGNRKESYFYFKKFRKFSK